MLIKHVQYSNLFLYIYIYGDLKYNNLPDSSEAFFSFSCPDNVNLTEIFFPIYYFLQKFQFWIYEIF